MDATNRFLAYAAAQAGAVGVLVGFLLAVQGPFNPFSLHSTVHTPSSDLAALAALTVVLAFALVCVALYVVVPVAVAGYLARRGDRHPLYYAGLGTLALLSVPGLVAAPSLFNSARTVDRYLGVAALLPAVVLVALAGRAAVGRARERHDWSPPPAALFFNVALAVVLVAGLAPSALLGAPTGLVEGTMVEVASLDTPPVAFDADYAATGDGRGALIITHTGGDTVPADRLRIVGTGFAAVDGVDQTRPGTWRGTASGASEDGTAVVAADDAVTVGVADDCVVRVVYQFYDRRSTLYKYTCAESG